MSFRAVFIALTIGFGLVIAAFLLNRARPPLETAQPTAALIRASGKCAECHTQQQHSIVHEFELSVHAARTSPVWIAISRPLSRTSPNITDSPSAKS